MLGYAFVVELKLLEHCFAFFLFYSLGKNSSTLSAFEWNLYEALGLYIYKIVLSLGYRTKVPLIYLCCKLSF